MNARELTHPVAGTFFPISNLPGWAQFLANFNRFTAASSCP
jgi:hypothetical protein